LLPHFPFEPKHSTGDRQVAMDDRAASSRVFLDLHASEAQIDAHTMRERSATAIKLGFDGVAFVAQADAVLKPTDR
jgi:hypothetical protein